MPDIKFEPGSRIRIATQPRDLFASVQGAVGVIEEIKDNYAYVRTYDLDGGLSGSGAVPLDCLEPFSSPILDQKIGEWENKVAEVGREAERRRARWNQIAKDASVRFGIDEKIVVEIMRLGRDFE